jgi:hypothetical protein
MREIPLTQGKVALVDDEDYERLSCHKWRALRNKNRWYAMRDGGGRKILMHREIMGAPQGLQVDHIDGNGLNNQSCNLRICTNAENQHNQGVRSSNTSGFKGVSWYKRYRKWQVAIRIDGERKYLGYFSNKVEAARAYDNAAKRYHGEFARLNCV